MRLLELKNTSRPLFDWKLQVITFLVEKHSQKVLRKLPVSSRNVSKLLPGAPWSHGATPREIHTPRNSEKVPRGKIALGGGKVGSAVGRPTASFLEGGEKAEVSRGSAHGKILGRGD